MVSRNVAVPCGVQGTAWRCMFARSFPLCTVRKLQRGWRRDVQVVNPKLSALRLQENRLQMAEVRFDGSCRRCRGLGDKWGAVLLMRVWAKQAELKLQTDRLLLCKQSLDVLQLEFEAKLAEKARIERSAAATRQKMEQAAALLGSLGGEQERWKVASTSFAHQKLNSVGDCLIAAMFLSYCGPFNQHTRYDLLVAAQRMSD